MQFGAFEAWRVCGRGGMGVVYEGRHRENGTPAAIKVLSDLKGSEATRRGFGAEIRALARLDHPHIAAVFDHGYLEPSEAFPGGAAWFAMEYCGGRLSDDARAVSTYDDLRHLLQTLMETLAFAHARGVVHRDLKLGNVLVATPSDSRPGLKIVDFGIALLDEPGTEGVHAGTPIYMPPEQWMDATRSGPWTDVYALGALAWLLTTGRRPFRGREGEALLEAKLAADPGSYHPRMPVPAGLESWLRTCLEPSITQRFQCIPDAIAALQRVGAAGTIEARPAVVPAPDVWPVASNPSTVMARTGVSLLPFRQPQLLGRQEERKWLWERLRAADRGEHRWAHLHGRPGVGASALGEWLVEAARRHSGVVAASVRARSGNAPGMAASRLVRSVLNIAASGEDGLDEGRSALRRLGAGTRGADLALQASVSDDVIDPSVRVRAACTLLQAITRRRTLAVFLDGIDQDPSLQLLAALAEREVGDRLLVVTTGGHVDGESLQVEPVNNGVVQAMVSYLVPLEPASMALVLDQAAGRPGWAFRAVVDAANEGRLRPHPQGFSIDRDSRRPSQGLLGDLAPAGVTALLRAAILGPMVDREVWEKATQELQPVARLLAEEHAFRQGWASATPSGWAFERAEVLQRLRRSVAAKEHYLACAPVVAGIDPLLEARCWARGGEVERAARCTLSYESKMTHQHGHLRIRDWLRELGGLADAQLEPDESLHGMLWNRFVVHERLCSDFEEAERQAHSLVERFTRNGWPRATALAWWNLSLAQHGTPKVAYRSVQAGLETLGDTDAPYIRGLLLYRLAQNARSTGRSTWTVLAEQAREHMQRAGTEQAWLYENRIGELLALAVGDHERALRHLDAMIERSRTRGDSRLDDALVHRAICLAALERYDEARTSLVEAAELARLHSPRSGLPNALANLACVDARQGHWSEARRQLLEVLQLPQVSGSHLLRACRLLLAAASAQLGRWREVDDLLPPLLDWLQTSTEADGDVLMALEGLREAAEDRAALCATLDPLVARYRELIPGCA